MGKGYTYNDVRDYINGDNGNGCKLSSTEYIGVKHNLEIICKCGVTFNTSFDVFKNANKKQCNQCGFQLKLNNLKMPFSKVKNYIEGTSKCKLLSCETDYKNTKEKLHFLCECDNEFYMSLEHFKRSEFKVCPTCLKTKRRYYRQTNYKAVKIYIESFGFTLLSDEYINSTSKLKIKCINGHIFYMPFADFKYGRRCRRCFYDSRSGENHHNWNGGSSSERDLAKHSPEYKKWRKQVFERDNYTCQCCSRSISGTLQAHHILNWCDHIDLRLDVTNGITLCKNCHDFSIKGSFHNIYGTKNNTKEQLDTYIQNYKESSKV